MPAASPELVERFRSLHVPGRPLLLANAWDAGSARLLVSLGFEALASTSSGHAATLGLPDGAVTRDDALAHAAALAAAVDVPISCDFENGFADDPAGVASFVTDAIATGIAGCSIEDWDRAGAGRLYDIGLAKERVAAAVDAAAGRVVVTARAENHLHGVTDLADTIARLQAFQEAGADVLYAPGLTSVDDIRTVVDSVDRPVNVIAIAAAPSVPELASVGVARVSVGGGFAYAGYGGVVAAARELLDAGTTSWWSAAGVGAKAFKAAVRRN